MSRRWPHSCCLTTTHRTKPADQVPQALLRSREGIHTSSERERNCGMALLCKSSEDILLFAIKTLSQRVACRSKAQMRHPSRKSFVPIEARSQSESFEQAQSSGSERCVSRSPAICMLAQDMKHSETPRTKFCNSRCLCNGISINTSNTLQLQFANG